MKSANVATLALYEALNDEQKKKADELILGMGMMWFEMLRVRSSRTRGNLFN